MSKICKKTPYSKGVDSHQKYLSRITKTLYYGKLPRSDVLSFPVTELAVEMFSEVQKGKSLDRLHWDTAAQISRNASVSPCSLVLAMLYFDRLKNCKPEYLERTAPADLFLVSLMVSSKYLFDDGECNEVFMKRWANSGGITCKQLVSLEKEFLKAIDWEIYVNELAFWKKLGEVETELAKRQAMPRGHFTYTELQVLAAVLDIQNIIHCIFAVSLILAATYTAGLMTLTGSVFLASHIPGTSLYLRKMDYLLPIESCIVKPEEKTNFTLDLHENKTDLTNNSGSWNIVKLLKTGILLASIKADISDTVDNTTSAEFKSNHQSMSWDWWNVPIMNWLTKTAQIIDQVEIPLRNYVYFLESAVVGSKHLYLEDHIHKATKTRIQDQMESSWHKEWIDSLSYPLYSYQILPYLRNIKS
ncbi:protein CNPPD1 [Cylas formicarius]|uniref:protein CNPPD1 n=1 Tax=Cylas formicarius TaxID=197179 RepID=UPI00295844B7|nr:protein CNPPD1 [Cylas formicarius]